MDTLKGNLDLFGLEAIAGLLSTARKTGALRVAVDGLNGRLFFVDGALVYDRNDPANIPVTDFSLGQADGKSTGHGSGNAAGSP